jgi:hypothetical protein
MTSKWGDALKAKPKTVSTDLPKAFPFWARVHFLAADYLDPLWLKLSAIDEPRGFMVWKFISDIVEFQARRLARREMLSDAPEAPWLYRDLYQLDECDARRHVTAGIPRDALLMVHPQGWLLTWQYHLQMKLGDRALGRKPANAEVFALVAPEIALQSLIDAEID